MSKETAIILEYFAWGFASGILFILLIEVVKIIKRFYLRGGRK